MKKYQQGYLLHDTGATVLPNNLMNLTADRTGDVFWLTNHIHFHDQNIFDNSFNLLKKEYDKSTEDFIEHFKKTYLEPFPPAWILWLTLWG